MSDTTSTTGNHVKDTLTCVGVPITLFWPITSASPVEQESLLFSNPGDTLICHGVPLPYSHNECWNVKVFPEPPANHIRVQLMDTTATGAINYIVCIWKPGLTIESKCLPLCRLVAVECNSSVELCADENAEGDSTKHCIKLENFDCH